MPDLRGPRFARGNAGGNPALTDDDLKAVLVYMRKSFLR